MIALRGNYFPRGIMISYMMTDNGMSFVTWMEKKDNIENKVQGPNEWKETKIPQSKTWKSHTMVRALLVMY
jgi:hypothetical protein